MSTELTAKQIKALKTIAARLKNFAAGRQSATVDPQMRADLYDLGLVTIGGFLTDAGLKAARLDLRRAPWAKPIYTGPSEKRENRARRRARARK